MSIFMVLSFYCDTLQTLGTYSMVFLAKYSFILENLHSYTVSLKDSYHNINSFLKADF